jgi:RNA polymerase sigma-70 factor (ECF subfamily)
VVPTDAALVSAARNGEGWAQEALFRRHMAAALGLAQRILGRQSEAEDVVQDAFVEAFARLERLDNPQAFAGWLRAIVVHRVQKHLRRQQLLRRLGLQTRTPIDPDVLIAPGAPAEAVQELRAVYGVLGRLPGEERVALVLRRVEGLDLGEIALQMGLSLATVKRRLGAAEARLERVRGEP